MSKRILFLLAVVTTMLLSSCGEKKSADGYSIDKKTKYEYKFHTSNKGEKIKPKDMVVLDYVIRKDTMIFNSSYKMGNSVVFFLPDASKITPDLLPLMKMTAGDSLTARFLVDSLKKYIRPLANDPNVKPGDKISIDYKVSKVMSEEQYKGQARQLRDSYRADSANVVNSRPAIEALLLQDIADYKANKLGDKLITAPSGSGLKYVIHEMGTQKSGPLGAYLHIQYFGKVVSSGKTFDDSYERGMPISVSTGRPRVIPGWVDAIGTLPIGTKATLFIPAELGYGEKGTPDGSIPANAEIAFYVEFKELTYIPFEALDMPELGK